MKYSNLQILNCCSKAQLAGYNNIYGLNGYQIPGDKDTIYKYTPLHYLIDDVYNNRLSFVSPDNWEDSFETRYYKLDNYQRKLGFTEPEIFCMCLTSKQAENEDAFWRRYARAKAQMVWVKYDINELFKALDTFAEENNIKIFIGEAIYLDKAEILRITPTQNKIFFPQAPKKFDIEHYLSLMSLKRGAFSYENEIRIFVVSNDGFDESVKVYRVSENCSHVQTLSVTTQSKQSHIKEVRISPYAPVNENFKLIEKHCDNIQGLLPQGIRITQSQLCERCPKCKL